MGEDRVGCRGKAGSGAGGGFWIELGRDLENGGRGSQSVLIGLVWVWLGRFDRHGAGWDRIISNSRPRL